MFICCILSFFGCEFVNMDGGFGVRDMMVWDCLFIFVWDGFDVMRGEK